MIAKSESSKFLKINKLDLIKIKNTKGHYKEHEKTNHRMEENTKIEPAICDNLSVSHSVVSDSLQPHEPSPPGSSVHGILQATILEWVAISFSRVS